jgi:hypothetical protein
MELKLGQVVEFHRAVQVEGKLIGKGARARVAHILTDLLDPKVTLILLDGEKPQSLVVDRPVVTVNAFTVQKH